MTTPQDYLYKIHTNLIELLKMFEPDENHVSIFDRIQKIETEQMNLSKKMEVIENQMNLIIKLLSYLEER